MKTNVILDSYHRLKVLKYLGYKKISVIFVNYFSPRIKVFSWENNEKVNKK